MKRIASGSAILLLCLAIVLPSMAAQEKDQVVLEGNLLTAGCYLKHNTWGKEKHKACSERCTSQGIPAGILTAEKKFVPLVVPVSKLTGYMEETVRATGRMQGGMLLVDKLEVKIGDEWKLTDAKF